MSSKQVFYGEANRAICNLVQWYVDTQSCLGLVQSRVLLKTPINTTTSDIFAVHLIFSHRPCAPPRPLVAPVLYMIVFYLKPKHFLSHLFTSLNVQYEGSKAEVVSFHDLWLFFSVMLWRTLKKKTSVLLLKELKLKSINWRSLVF